jgi:hypothetical protein
MLRRECVGSSQAGDVNAISTIDCNRIRDVEATFAVTIVGPTTVKRGEGYSLELLLPAM